MASAAHDAYVRVVVDELTERGIQVSDVVVGAGDVLRAEMVVAEVDPMHTSWRDAEGVVRLYWDQRQGWTWQVRYAGESQSRGAVHFGVSAVPQPTAVADWMLISLTHPEAVPSREDGPFETADLEAVLRAYAMR
jgi:hypothetical protein